MGFNLGGALFGGGAFGAPGAVAGSGAANNGITGIGRALGLSGDQGTYFAPGAAPTMDTSGLQQASADQAVNQNAGLNTDIANYGQGKMSLSDIMAAGMGNTTGGGLNQFESNLVTNPLSGSKLATDQVQGNGILGQLYGKGGSLEQATNEESNLANQGFKLQPQDVEAYGQASGNIARQFGQNEQNLTQSLADRGLSSGPNGAAAVEFSGLQGNKNEALAGAQMNIANMRMNNTLDRLNSVRSYQENLANQGQSAIGQQEAQNMSGVQNRQDQNKNLMSAQQNKYMGDINNYNAQNTANLNSSLNQQGREGQTLGKAFGNGLFSGVQSSGQQVGAAPGKYLTSQMSSGGAA